MTSWIFPPFSTVNNNLGKLRMFCFPWAGGGANFYKQFFSDIHHDIEVYPIQLPGRENRYGETFYEDMNSLCEDFLNEFGTILEEKPYVFWGHSMGGIISYYLVQMIEEKGGKLPIHLLLSSSAPPKRRTVFERQSIHYLLKENGTQEEILQNQELLDIYLPTLLADLKLLESIQVDNLNHRIEVPTTVFGGKSDNLLPIDDLYRWSNFINEVSEFRLYQGGHMYIKNNRDQLLRDIEKIINYNDI